LTDPTRKETMGCTGPAKQRHVRGPESQPDWIDICPARFVGGDAIDLVVQHELLPDGKR